MAADGSAPRVAVLTGAAGGLGQAMALRFAERGYHAVVSDLDLGAAERAVERLPDGRATALRCDVADTASVEAAIAELGERFGRIDALVNNAGMVDPAPSHEVGDEAWDRLLGVHLGGTFRMSRAALPLLARSGAGGTVVNISSVCAHRGFPGRLSYTCAKAAIEALTRTLAVEWGTIGIRVNAVAPGFILTENSARLYESGVASAEVRAELTALGRLGRPEEIAEATCWLAGDESSYVTGETIVVDGGYLVNGRTGPDPAAYTAEELRSSLAHR